MAKTRLYIQRRGDGLFAANSEALQSIRSLPTEKDYAVDIVHLRNGPMHRKAFAYMQLAFSYWEPKSYVSIIEKETVKRLGIFLSDNGIDESTAATLCKQFLIDLNVSRSDLGIEKDFNAFRDFVTVETGFYDHVVTPEGPRKIARSWAYKNMGQDEFQRLFDAIRRVCWDLILSQTFGSIEEADLAAEQLMNFD